MNKTGNFAVEVNGVKTQERYPDLAKAIRVWASDPDHSEVVELAWRDPVTGEERMLRRLSGEECLRLSK